MADNYLERQYEQYEARKAAWEKSRKHKLKKVHTPAKTAERTETPLPATPTEESK